MRPVINTHKHYFHTPSTNTASGARANVDVITVNDARAAATDVLQGSIVKAVFVEYWVAGAVKLNTVNACIYKIPSGSVGPTYTEMQNMGSYANKKNVFAFHQGLAPADGNIVPLFREWIKVPKGKQRFGLGDKMRISISATGTTITHCGFSTFKEYY